MSLINEALKKAQRLRAEQQAHYSAPPMPGGASPGRIAKRGQAMPAQTLVLLLSAGTVLIVLSAVITGYFLSRPPEPPPVAAPRVAKPAVVTAAASPVIIAPVIALPKPAPEPPPPEPAPTTAPAPATARTTPQAAPAVKPAEPAAPAPVLPREVEPTAVKPDPRVQVYVDSVRVAGIRFSGNESKVLMNDRVYRVNDVVEHALNVRLEKVSADSLTFVDANGIAYVKNF